MSVTGASKASELAADPSRAYSLVAIPPQPFDKYTLIGKLGHGGMAEVNLAVALGKGNFKKLVVIKRLHRHLAMEPGFVDMFLDEARLAARLNHPHCVQTHEVGEWQDNHFLAMEYLDGQGLERLLRISGQKGLDIPFDLAARIVSDALDGLAYAHELADFDGSPLGVVHRDVSPQNIFITYNGVVKLLDFGIAKAATHVVETRTGVIKGKYAYIAPEQALAQELDHRADLWSMGVVLWELLTGRRLFKSVNELATLHETLQGEIKLPSAFRPDLPTDLDTICMRALERDVDGRYQTAQEMKEEIDRYLATLPKPPGRSAIARMMRERFDQVIETHQRTLAQCLKGGALELSASSIQQLVEMPMVTPTGMSPLSEQKAGPSVTPTPTPTPSNEHLAALAAPPSGATAIDAPPQKRGGAVWKLGLVFVVALIAGAIAMILPLGDGAGETTARTGDEVLPAEPVAVPAEPAGAAAPGDAPAVVETELADETVAGQPLAEQPLAPQPTIEPAGDIVAPGAPPAGEQAVAQASAARQPRRRTGRGSREPSHERAPAVEAPRPSRRRATRPASSPWPRRRGRGCAWARATSAPRRSSGSSSRRGPTRSRSRTPRPASRRPTGSPSAPARR
ncbi:MAG: protein kinase [Sandaracinaceae bacterium]|nr:protein kinase [Sandaracinaceae bacterium]